ncbi:thioredoxin family protein [Algoriphagus halophytocola]|uniref:Thioredoxin family protein n=1 Tax=Algoriphagus halophytocola TaxID=2991499 RepID=A0ABY6MII0_9BACT|nr:MULTISPECIES: thioredoxin family protein [unclassified Algoriphagus]UZD22091.1 thioredoxin family protein [Algoriphagus sp. TR-M5]WBL43342.1 thioredoxin family protein [Algoriphagus sp. TR-M9]
MLDQQVQLITPELIASAMNYSEYKNMIAALLEENKTTGANQSESYLNYTKMSMQRMKRWDKTVKVAPELEKIVSSISSPQVWLVITEAWCGDAAQSMPFVAKLAGMNPLIELKFVLRDENPELMDAYLTEGARSIPILIALSADLSKELFVWGPRPKFLQDRLKAYKLDPQNITPKEFADGTHLWYARDKNKAIAEELTPLIASTI